MYLKFIFLLIFFSFITSCDRKKEGNQNFSKELKDTTAMDVNTKKEEVIEKDTNNNPDQESKDYSDACFILVRDMVMESNVLEKLKGQGDILIDDFSDQLFSIKMIIKNENDEPMPVGWLELDLKKNQLRDITNDPDEPVILPVDSLKWKELKDECLK